MRTRTIATTLFAGIAALLPLCARADGLRCGNKLVLAGDTRASVRQKCGEPADVSQQTLLRQASFIRHGRIFFSGDALIEVPMELWTYNFGPNRLMRRLRFVGSLLEDVETLGYGYNTDQ